MVKKILFFFLRYWACVQYFIIKCDFCISFYQMVLNELRNFILLIFWVVTMNVCRFYKILNQHPWKQSYNFLLKSVNKESYLDRVSHFDPSFQCMDKLSWSVYHKVLHSTTSMRELATVNYTHEGSYSPHNQV